MLTFTLVRKIVRVYAPVPSVLSQHEYLEKINKTFDDFDRLHKANVGMRQQFEKRYMRCKEKQKNLQERMLKVVGRAHKHLVQVGPQPPNRYCERGLSATGTNGIGTQTPVIEYIQIESTGQHSLTPEEKKLKRQVRCHHDAIAQIDASSTRSLTPGCCRCVKN